MSAWNAQQAERNHYVRFRTDFTFERLVPLARDGSYRILDYGCGEGHSLEAVLDRFPNSRFVAADFTSASLDACDQHFGSDPRLQIIRMTGPESLDAIDGTFDIIQLNAVYEHLLPHERPLLMSRLWRMLLPGGYMVITETPWRWFPIETHCTSLPFVNYLPDRWALSVFRSCKRFPDDATMEYALRDGLRGTTVSQIIESLSADEDSARVVYASQDDARDLLESWWHGECRQTASKRAAYRMLSAVRTATGLVVSPWINIAIRKAGR